MNTKLLTIFTRTPLHVGCGSSVGAVDQPVVRERHTRFPVIPGSSIKGVLADLWLEHNDDGSLTLVEKDSVRDADGVNLLGSTDNRKAQAGSLLIGEGKLLAFPVRSARKCFAWITCPLALARFARDTGRDLKLDAVKVADGRSLAPDALKIDDSVVFEEYPLVISGAVPDTVIKNLADLVDGDLWKELKDRLAVVSDELFQYFAENACEIANHNRIDDVTGVVQGGALFSQENVPSETLFYAMLNTKKADDFGKLETKLAGENNLLQIGAHMTTGLGWCSVATKEVK